MVTVNRDGLARLVADKAAVGTPSISEAKAMIDAIFEAIRERAEAGDTIRTAVGSFSVRARPARIGRNPATGAPLAIPETRRLVFKAARKALG